MGRGHGTKKAGHQGSSQQTAGKPSRMTAPGKAACSSVYTPYPFAVPSVYLDVSIQPGTTRVTSVVDYVPLDTSTRQQRLQLRGEGLELLELFLDGEVLPEGSYTWDQAGCKLVIQSVPNRPFQLKAVTAIHPEQQTDLEGVFCIGGVYATQCEATQFSMMTFFPDRPDVLSLWRVRLEAPQDTCPVLLSNGNLAEAGKLEGGGHFTVWVDPFPKPCYLFSLVAGDLALKEDSHTTHTGRTIKLKTYVPAPYIDQLQESMTAIKAAMTWDEAAFGREYDLDTYTMVGLEGFNDDATETKGLSLFAINILAAMPDLNSDDDVGGIRSLVAHEYFHNWSGNRVTLCDWLNLTVKEGLTVYREHQFMADLEAAAAAVKAPYGSADWEPELLSKLYSMAAAAARGLPPDAPQQSSWRRVFEAGYLRENQFDEDEGPLAHPIRPRQVKSMKALYTDTVYSKGAAVVRMFLTLLGPEGFQRGVETFFNNNDAKAVPCEAFCEALCTANRNHASLLKCMLPWYDTPGTPELTVSTSYSPANESLTITIKQRNETAKQTDKALNKPVLIPFKIGLVRPDGQDLPLHLKPSSSSKQRNSDKSSSSSKPVTTPEGIVYNTGLQGSVSISLVLLVDSWSQSFTFTRLPDKPYVSLLRDFSAPVRLVVEGETDSSLGFLAAHDSNPFARWDAMQRLMSRLLIRLYDRAEEHADSIQDMDSLAAVLAETGGMPPALLSALQAALAADDLDGDYQASLLQLPSVMGLVSLLDEPDPELLWMVWVYVGQQLARSLQEPLQRTISQCDDKLKQLDPGFGHHATKTRALKNAALGLLSYDWTKELQQQLLDRYHTASCMTDRLAALELLADEDSPARTAALQHFEDTYRDHPLAMLKWLYVQAASDIDGNVQHVAALMDHPAFDITKPPACEHLLLGFAGSVPNFHAEDGSGYTFMADAVLKVDKVNSQVAADLVQTLVDWEAFDEARQGLMLAQLKRIAALRDEISQDVMELVQQVIY